MELQVDIAFEQLVKLVKKLPLNEWAKLKQEVEKEITAESQTSDLETFLLKAPTFTKTQLNEIDKTRKAINQWRTK